VLREDVGPGDAPMAYKCGVFVNHHYKLIFIRNRKAASTTVLDTFKVCAVMNLCGVPTCLTSLKQPWPERGSRCRRVAQVACKSQSKLLCMRPYDAVELAKQDITADEMWRSYFVVSSTRNPWARAASGYDYTQDRCGLRRRYAPCGAA
jgi:hypothetical protein